jgi:hypothetical protein
MFIAAARSVCCCCCCCAFIDVSHTGDSMSVRIRVRLITKLTAPQPQHMHKLMC